MTQVLEKYASIGQSGQGSKAYPTLVRFKMTLLQTWYNLSDYGIEEQVNDTLSLMRCCGLRLEDDVPDHSVVCRFRKALTHSRAWEVLLEPINHQLTQYGALVKQGATWQLPLSPPRLVNPKARRSHTLPPERQAPVQRSVQPGVDQETSWVKKGSKLQYGYKRHYLAESKEGFVLAVPTRSRVLADKGYCAQANEALLASQGLRSGIQRKAYRNKPLTRWAKRYNKLVGSDTV